MMKNLAIVKSQFPLCCYWIGVAALNRSYAMMNRSTITLLSGVAERVWQRNGEAAQVSDQGSRGGSSEYQTLLFFWYNLFD